MELSSRLADNIKYFHQKLNVENDFDMVYRVAKIGGREVCIYFIDDLTKGDMLLKVLQVWEGVKPENMPKAAHEFSKLYLPYGEVGLVKNEDDMIARLLSGTSCFFINDYDTCLTMDYQTYPTRDVSGSERGKVLCSPCDGFVETLILNTALMRRRIRDPELAIEIMNAGEGSHTDIAIYYMKGRVDEGMLDQIKNRVRNPHVGALAMNQESLVERLYPSKWFDPFPKFRSSEHPDTAAASILKGNIIILMDSSPAVTILPSSVFNIIEEAGNYYLPPITGTYLRLSRMVIFILILFLTPTWLLFVRSPGIIPSWLEFIQLSDPAHVPLTFQLLIPESVINGFRLTVIITPSTLTTPLSVIAEIVLGEYSVKSDWLNGEAMLYMASVTVADYSQASFELGRALRFMHVLVLITITIPNYWGYTFGIIFSVHAIVFGETTAGKSYIYPLLPFS